MSVQTRDREIVDLEHKRQATTAELSRIYGRRLPRKHQRVLSRLTKPGRV